MRLLYRPMRVPRAQVLYLDADNIPVRDPSQLFASAQYNASGALFWQDYWENTLAPQVSAPRRSTHRSRTACCCNRVRAHAPPTPPAPPARSGRACARRCTRAFVPAPGLRAAVPAAQVSDMLRLPRRRWFGGSFESGQLVVDKRRHWRGLALAVYFNSYAAFW